MIIAYLILCHNLWVRIVQRVGYEMSESGYETTGYRSGSVELVTQKCDFETKLLQLTFQFYQDFCLLESRNLSHKGHASFMSESMETTFITL